MNFQRGHSAKNGNQSIALIDVLLVILIFLMVTTSYAKFSELQINLPQAGGDASAAKVKAINVTVDASEHYGINNQGCFLWRRTFASALRNAAGDQADPIMSSTPTPKPLTSP